MDQPESLLAGLELEHPGDQPLKDSDVVISGMSSLMPGCENLKEWAEKLYKKENMVTSKNSRWKYSHPELPPFKGEVPGVDRCDSQFFMINSKTGHSIDPGSRKLLEQAYQALFDAGVAPAEISRKRVGVFIAASHSESEKFYSKTIPSGIFGNNRAMFANRISYWMNVTGPSYVIDAACSGSVVALERAMQAIQTGQCEAALVGAAKLVLHPMTVIHSNRAVPQNFDGKTKCYDVNADGASISDSVSVIFLQKFKDARRVYAQLCHVKCEYSEGLDKDYSIKLGYNRKPEVISKFLRRFYDEAGVSPSSVEYVEGFGSADPATDKSELQAIEDVFCAERTDPLLVGSVTSNMGLSKPVSGLNGIIKILHAYQTGVLPANLNCDNPRQDIQAVRKGRLQIVTEHRPIRRTYTALNNFSLTGMNGHVLLKGYYKKKDLSKYKSDLPYLVTASGRQESGVKKVLDSIKSSNLDAEELALLREVYKLAIPNHLGRGFGLFASNDGKTVIVSENVNKYDETVRQLWFVYSGMGSQWAGMGTHLMRIPKFAEAILRCDKVLKPKGINIVEIITSNDERIFDNVMNAFVGITAIQIGLTDVLNAVGLMPDKIIGHSVGELGCAYADNCLTTEETILLSYSRGLVSVQVPFIKGSMAAVGLGYKEISKLCPPEIEVACHNGPDSSTLSGPAEIMKEFVKELTERGIFAREVNCSNIAYHSRYIVEAGPLFLKMGQTIIKNPKLRSKRWVSTSVPIERRKKYHAMFSSAEYHTNNLLSPVLFEEACRQVPNGAVLVEIAPHGLLQAILKRSLPADCRNVSLTSRAHSDASVHLLEALGKLYMQGYNVDTSIFYPKVEYPVSTKTRQFSHLVEHLHDVQWKICCYAPPEKQFTSTYKPIVTVYDEEYKYLKGSFVEGSNVFPFAGILVFVWDTLAMSLGKKRKQPVEFKDVRFYEQSLIVDYRPKKYTITLLKQSGRFEVIEESNCLVADGFLSTFKTTSLNEFPKTNEKLELARADVYKLLFEKGYEFANELQSIHKANLALTKAEIEWKDDWTTFIDGIFQLLALRQEHDGVSQPTCIKRFIIDTNMHAKVLSDIINHFVPLKHSDIENMTRCGGVLVNNVIFKNKTTNTNEHVAFKTLKYIPFDEENNDVLTNLYIAMQIVAENIGSKFIKVLSLNNNHQTDILHKIKDILQSKPEINIFVTSTYDTELIKTSRVFEKPNIIFINNEDIDKQIFNLLHNKFNGDTFLLLLGVEKNYVNPKFYKSIFKAGTRKVHLELFKSIQPKLAESIVFPVKNEADLDRLRKLRKDLSSKQSLTVVTCYPPIPGVQEIVQQMRAEDTFQAYLAMINGKKAEIDLKKLHNLDLAVNVYQNDKWGGEYFVPLKEIKKTSENIALHIKKCGDLDSLYWLESKDHKNEASVAVHFAGLNILDAKLANGEISAVKNYRFGMDFSGLTERKEPVMGMIPDGAARSRVSFRRGLLWPVPDHWSLEDASTVPLPYCLAFYCLRIKLHLVRGMNVLIHGGAGALGQAAIYIALAHNCTVFTTVSDMVKKRFLRKLFPDLPENHIGNSRDESFMHMVQNLTNGNGCEIIISNVKRNLKNTTLHCCAMAGTTLDLVQIHERDNFEYTMSFMTKGRSYCLVDFKSVFDQNNEDILKKLQWMVSDGIARGYVRPLSRVTYGPSEVSRAFRLLSDSRHRGRVLIRLTGQQSGVEPQIFCHPEATYLIVCDSKGFGFKLVDKLIASGAKKLHIHLSAQLPHILYKLQQWNKLGAQVEVSSKNLDNNSKIETLFGKLNCNGTVDAIFIIRDDASLLLKLDQISRKLFPNLRYFVVISGKQPVLNICQKRLYSGFPVVLINIFIKKLGTANQEKFEFGWKRAVEIIENAIHAKESNILVYVKEKKQTTMIEKMKYTPGEQLSSDRSDKMTSGKVGIDDGKSLQFRKSKCDVKVDEEITTYLTIAELKQLHSSASVNKGELGIEVYFQSICPDELMANLELVPIGTMLKNTNMRADDLIIEDAHMFIVPGLEGHHERFKALCKRLKIAAAVLQLGYDTQNETIQETAQRFSNVIMHKLKYKNHFYLLGYEYGVPIVLEVAAILEAHGMTGTVYCLGGSPEEIRGDIENRLNGLFEYELQNHIIQHFCSLATQNVQLDLTEPLNSQQFEDKIRLCIKKIQDQTPFNSQYLSDVIVSAYKRINFIRNYKYDLHSLKSKVILIKAIITPITYSFPASASFELHVPLQDILGDLKCPSIINKHLELNVLDEFNTKNLCQSYLTNGEDSFIKWSIPFNMR